jgi:hypothetical protein
MTSPPPTPVPYGWVAAICVTLRKPNDPEIAIDLLLNWRIDRNN